MAEATTTAKTNAPKGAATPTTAAKGATDGGPMTTTTDTSGAAAGGDAGAGAPAAGTTAPVAAEADSSTGAKGKDIVPAKYRDIYAANKGTCGDFIAQELSAVMEKDGVASLSAVKVENGINTAAWAGLNNGQQRMNVSNALRSAYLQGKTIKILGKEFSLDGHKDDYEAQGKPLDASNEAQVKKFLSFIDMPENSRNMGAVRKYFHDGPAKAVERAKREEAAAKAKEQREADKAKKAEEKKAADAKKAEEAKAAAEKKAADKKAADDAKAAAAKTDAKK